MQAPSYIPPPPGLIAALPSEDIVLASMLASKAATARALSVGLEASAFEDTDNQRAAALHMELFQRLGTASAETLVSELKERGSLATGEAQRLYELAGRRHDPALFADHLDRLLSASRLRRLMGAMDGLRRRVTADNTGSMRQRLQAAQDGVGQMLRLVSDTETNVSRGSELAEYALMEERYVPTGLASLDDLIKGFPMSRVTMLVARTSHGKTTTAVELTCRHVDMIRRGDFGEEGGQAVYFSCEMSRQKMTKLIAKDRGVGYFQDAPLVIDETARPTTKHMMGRCLAESGIAPVSLVVFDYLQYTGERGASRRDRLDDALAGCHELAKRLACPVVVLAQLNRGADDHDRPRVTDIKDTGAGEEVGAMVLAPFWPWMHWYQTGEASEEPRKDRYMIYALKSTFGAVGHASLVFDQNRGRILDPSEAGRVIASPF